MQKSSNRMIPAGRPVVELVVGIVVVLIILGLAGCGGSSSAKGTDTTITTAALSASGPSPSNGSSTTVAPISSGPGTSVLGPSGPGASSPSGPASSTTIDPSIPADKARFIALADTICQAGADELRTIQIQALAPDDEIKAAAPKFIAVLEKERNDLAKLPRPTGDEAVIEDLVAKLGEGIDKIRTDPVGTFNDSSNNVFADAMVVAKSYGFKVCGV